MDTRAHTLLLLLGCFGCAPLAVPAASPPTAPAAPSATGAEVPAASATASASPLPPQRPLDLTNNCPHEIRVYFGQQPGDGKGEFTSIAGGGSLPVARGADGAVVVWVVSDQGTGIATVNVTRRMRHVRIDTACMKIEADSAR